MPKDIEFNETFTSQRAGGTVLRAAERSDAADMARLVNMAGEGMPAYLWAGMIEPGDTIWDVGQRRAERDAGAFSWRNATMAVRQADTAGLLITYDIGDNPEPVSDLPDMFKPLQMLENQALSTLYVNVLAVYPAHRRSGVARALLDEAAQRAEGRSQSLIVADANTPARALYQTCGYREVADAPIVKEGWICSSTSWILMIRD